MNPHGITTQERLDLKKLLNDMNAEDNTKYIRKFKQSARIHADVQVLVSLLRSSSLSPDALKEDVQQKCPFLYEAYPDIFHKLLADEIDLTILTKLLQVLKLIEDEQVDQHEGSVLVGKVLKELYLDSAVRRGDHLDQQHAQEKPPQEQGRPLSWNEFKKGEPRFPLPPSFP